MKTRPDVWVAVPGMDLSGNCFDHHCVMHAGGEDWRITGMQGLGHVAMRNDRGYVVVDLSDLDVESYSQKAVQMLREQFPGSHI